MELINRKVKKMIKPLVRMVLLLLAITSCKDHNELKFSENEGYNMLLIGNSFFRPYAQKLDILAIDSGIQDHNQTLIMRGGDNGRPLNFWNDSTTVEHLQIKSVLDGGGVDIFGMTAGKLPENPIDGFKEWIEYALKNNPNIAIFLSVPNPDFPAQWDALVEDYEFDSIQELYINFINENIHNMLVNSLREEFPSTKIFTIPTGWAAINLNQMYEDDLLLDDINFKGSRENSIFTDEKGHQGDIVIETGGLIWLNSIYNIDLASNDYKTGFNTDLHAIANDIVNRHDPYYTF